MNQVFKIDPDKKQQIQASLYKRHTMSKVLYAWIALWAIANIAWLIYTLSDDGWMTGYTGEPEYKDWYMAWGAFACINTIGLFLFVVFRIIRWRLTGKHLSERVNETLSIKSGIVEYGYQNFADSSPDDRVVLLIKDWEAMAEDDKITLHGLINQKYYDNYLNGETRASDEYLEGDWVLYDYFVPSLKENIESYVKEPGY